MSVPERKVKNQQHYTSDYASGLPGDPAGVRHSPLRCAPLWLSWHCFALLSAEKTQRAATETSEQDLSQGAPLLLEESLHGPRAVRPASSPSLLLVSFLLAAFAHLLSSICLPKLHLLQEALMHLSTLHSF